jgi:hypothetical protein
MLAPSANLLTPGLALPLITVALTAAAGENRPSGAFTFMTNRQGGFVDG